MKVHSQTSVILKEKKNVGIEGNINIGIEGNIKMLAVSILFPQSQQ
jgi:hypothetical protein